MDPSAYRAFLTEPAPHEPAARQNTPIARPASPTSVLDSAQALSPRHRPTETTESRTTSANIALHIAAHERAMHAELHAAHQAHGNNAPTR